MSNQVFSVIKTKIRGEYREAINRIVQNYSTLIEIMLFQKINSSVNI